MEFKKGGLVRQGNLGWRGSAVLPARQKLEGLGELNEEEGSRN